MVSQDGESQFASYLTYRLALVNYVTPIIGSRADAEDIVQEVFLRFQPRKAGITGSPRAYLFKIAYNLAIDWTRRRKLETNLNSEDLPPWAGPRETGTPEKDALVAEDLRRISAYLESCPPEFRLALEMYRFGGHTMEQIAERLGVSVATVHRMLRKTMAALADLMEDGGGH